MVPLVRDHQIGKMNDDNSQHNGQLVKTNQTTTILCRRAFGNVGRSNGGCDSKSNATDQTVNGKNP